MASAAASASPDQAGPSAEPTHEESLVVKAVTLAWQSLSLDVRVKSGKIKRILHPSSGFFPPASLTGILGPSGAGKSSLLNLCASRTVKGKVGGHVTLNGQPVQAVVRDGALAYVKQEDVLLGALTVRETLLFAALLLLPRDMPRTAKCRRVDDIIHGLLLAPCADTLVGNELLRGISGGEKRRLSVALQLIEMPGIILADEPTTGLDTSSALVMVKAFKALISRGHTLVVTVHQPRQAIFDLFDTLALLAQGYLVYLGPMAGAAAHFASLGLAIPPNVKTADGLLDILFEGWKVPRSGRPGIAGLSKTGAGLCQTFTQGGASWGPWPPNRCQRVGVSPASRACQRASSSVLAGIRWRRNVDRCQRGPGGGPALTLVPLESRRSFARELSSRFEQMSIQLGGDGGGGGGGIKARSHPAAHGATPPPRASLHVVVPDGMVYHSGQARGDGSDREGREAERGGDEGESPQRWRSDDAVVAEWKGGNHGATEAGTLGSRQALGGAPGLYGAWATSATNAISTPKVTETASIAYAAIKDTLIAANASSATATATSGFGSDHFWGFPLQSYSDDSKAVTRAGSAAAAVESSILPERTPIRVRSEAPERARRSDRPSALEQYTVLVHRFYLSVRRNPAEFVTFTVENLIIHGLYALLFSGMDEQGQRGAISRAFYYMFVALYDAGTCVEVIPVYMEFRAVFDEERGRRMYHCVPYVLAFVTVSTLPYAGMVLAGQCVSYWAANIRHSPGHFFYYWLSTSLAVQVFMGFSMTATNCSRQMGIVVGSSNVIIVLGFLFCGVMVNYQQIPVYLRWLYWLNPLQYCVNGLLLNEFGTDDPSLGATFDFHKYPNRWVPLGYLALLVLAYQVPLTLLAMWRIGKPSLVSQLTRGACWPLRRGGFLPTFMAVPLLDDDPVDDEYGSVGCSEGDSSQDEKDEGDEKDENDGGGEGGEGDKDGDNKVESDLGAKGGVSVTHGGDSDDYADSEHPASGSLGNGASQETAGMTGQVAEAGSARKALRGAPTFVKASGRHVTVTPGASQSGIPEVPGTQWVLDAPAASITESAANKALLPKAIREVEDRTGAVPESKAGPATDAGEDHYGGGSGLVAVLPSAPLASARSEPPGPHPGRGSDGDLGLFLPMERRVMLTWRDVSYYVEEKSGKWGKGKGTGDSKGKHAGVESVGVEAPQPVLLRGKAATAKCILHPTSGAFFPGTLTAVMGPSGAGKTTMLNALGGRITAGILYGSVTIDGDMLISLAARKGLVAYVKQEEYLVGSLTVFETLLCCALLRLPAGMPRADKVERVRSVVRLLLLEGTENTLVGNELLRGISGGEKRRLSVALDMVVQPPLVLLDEPTSGLDASSALELVRALQGMVSRGHTVAATMHQPRHDIFRLLDCLVLLARGHVVFNGHAPDALPHFRSLGLVCPCNLNAADFLLDVLSEHQGEGRRYRARPGAPVTSQAGATTLPGNGDTDDQRGGAQAGIQGEPASPGGGGIIDAGGADPTDVTSSISGLETRGNDDGGVNATKGMGNGGSVCTVTGTRSGAAEDSGLDYSGDDGGGLDEILELLKAAYAKSVADAEARGEGPGTLGRAQSSAAPVQMAQPDRPGVVGYLVGSARDTAVLTWRFLIPIWRDPVELRFLAVQAAIFGVMWALLFSNVDKASEEGAEGEEYAAGRNRVILAHGSCLLWGLYMLAYVPIDTLDSLRHWMVIFREERERGAYSTVSFVAAQSAVNVIQMSLISLLFLLISYFAVGLRASNFLFVWLVFALNMFTTSATTFSLAALPSNEVAMALYNVFLLCNTLFSGYVLTKPEIPVHFRWAYYCSYFQYGFSATIISEYGDEAQDVFQPPYDTSQERIHWVIFGYMFIVMCVYRVINCLQLWYLSRPRSGRVCVPPSSATSL